MAAPRLPFLWPMLYRAVEAPTVRSGRVANKFRSVHSTPRRRQQETIPQRYGTANEPPDYLGGGKGFGPPTAQAQQEQAKLPKIGEKLQQDGEDEVQAEQEDAQAAPNLDQEAKRSEPTTVDGPVTQTIRGDPMLDAGEAVPAEPPPSSLNQLSEKPLESVLDSVPDASPSPSSTPSLAPEEEHPDISHDEHTPPVRAPHIEAPRYVHHFDTYGLVKRLADAGWSDAHAITIMKAMRLILADNMDLAKEALVSKSMVENETYLFRAACAELKTEATGRRQGAAEKMRTERAHLQHEVEILSQRVGQESGGLKDELKGMFDDRKMAVRNEQRGMESKIQQLNYKITVNLQADAKSDVEGLRWVMTRRVIIALATVVIMVVGSLKLYSNAVHEQELEQKRKEERRRKGQGGGSLERERERERKGEDMYVGDGGGEVGGAGREGPGEVVLKDGDNAGLVSLG